MSTIYVLTLLFYMESGTFPVEVAQIQSQFADHHTLELCEDLGRLRVQQYQELADENLFNVAVDFECIPLKPKRRVYAGE